MGILKSTREFKAPGAVKDYNIEVRGGGRDPGVRRPFSVGRQHDHRATMEISLAFGLAKN